MIRSMSFVTALKIAACQTRLQQISKYNISCMCITECLGERSNKNCAHTMDIPRSVEKQKWNAMKWNRNQTTIVA